MDEVKIKIDYLLSHQLNRLRFPEALWEDALAIGAEGVAEAELESGILEWRRVIRRTLAAFEKDIRRYFHPRVSLLDAIFLLSSPEESRDLSSWLNDLSKFDERTLRRAILRSISEKTAPPPSAAVSAGTSEKSFAAPMNIQGEWQDWDSLAEAKEAWPPFLEGSALPGDALWMLLGLLDAPLAAISGLRDLYQRLRSLSDALLSPRETEAEQSVTAFAALLEKDEKILHLLLPPSLVRERNEADVPELRLLLSLFPWESKAVIDERSWLLGFRIPALLAKRQNMAEQEQVRRVRLCKVLADPSRYRLCRLLAEGKRASGQELAEMLGIAPATLSHHMKQLREIGFVSEEEGRPAWDRHFAECFLRDLQKDLLTSSV